MRNTGAVNTSETILSDSANLVSATDLKSKIIYCNDEFVDYSGFSRDELIGQPHNIVRHPEMPQDAYKMMWERLKSGKSWMGIVKNRCKNGGFYWVNAYVTPLYENDEIVGYESVRTKADPEQINRAKIAYAKINEGRVVNNLIYRSQSSLNVFFILLSILIISFLSFNLFNTMANYLTSIFFTILCNSILGAWLINRFINNKLKISDNEIDDPLAQYIYTNNPGTFGRNHFLQIIRKKHLHTVLERLLTNCCSS